MAQQMEVMRFVESILKKMNESPIILRKIPVFWHRMIGLQEASGAYVTFVDSDDWVESDYVEVLYNKLIEYRADIAVGNYCKFNESDSNFYFHISGNYFEKLYDNVSIVDCLNDSNRLLNFSIW